MKQLLIIMVIVVVLACITVSCSSNKNTALDDPTVKSKILEYEKEKLDSSSYPIKEKNNSSIDRSNEEGKELFISSNVYVPKQLIAPVKSQEEAEEIAQLYQIKLIDLNEGIAVFETDELLTDVIERGQKNGWPKLSLNHINSAY